MHGKTERVPKETSTIRKMLMEMAENDQEKYRSELDGRRKCSEVYKKDLLQKRSLVFEAAVDYLMTIIKLEIDDSTPLYEVRLSLILPNNTYMRIKAISRGGIRVQRQYGRYHQVIHLLTTDAIFALGELAVDIQKICRKSTNKSKQRASA